MAGSVLLDACLLSSSASCSMLSRKLRYIWEGRTGHKFKRRRRFSTRVAGSLLYSLVCVRIHMIV